MRTLRWRQIAGGDGAVHTHQRHARGWIAIAAVVVVIAAHVWLFTTLSHAHGWMALAAAIAGIVALTVAWWRLRR